MKSSFIMLTSNLVNPLMAHSSGLSYLKYKGIDTDLKPIVILCKRFVNRDKIHFNKTEYTEPYIFGKTIDDIVDLPAILNLFNSYDNNLDMLTNITFLPQHKFLFEQFDDCIDKIKNDDVIFFSVFKYHFLYHLMLAFKIKKIYPNIKIVFGGPQIQLSELTRKVLGSCNFIDHIINGDVESGLFDYFTGKVNTKQYKSDDVDMSELQIPIYNTNGLYIYDNQIMLHTSRNCYNKCAYCPSALLNYRTISLEKIKQWVKYYSNDKHVECIYLTDAILNSSSKRFNEILDILIEYGNNLKYYLWCHPMSLTEEIFQKLKKLNFDTPGCLVIGCDIPSDRLRIFYDRPKNTGFDSIVKWCVDYDLKTMITFVIGTPNETEDDFIDMLDKVKMVKKYKDARIYPLYCSYMYIPGSPIFDNPENYNITVTNYNEDVFNIYKPLSDLISKTPQYYNGINPEIFSKRRDIINKVIYK